MANESQQNGFFEQAKTWWETDTAKAIATIIAVLLIPASVIAWNYATNRAENTEDTLGMVDEQNENANEDETATSDSEEDAESVANASEEIAAETAESSESDDSGQEPAEPSGIGGIEDLTELPDTNASRTHRYTIQNGDNVYRISMKVCGNESFYKSNLRKNYLKVGQTIEVNCNY